MSIGLRLLVLACSAAAIWSLADIAYIAIYLGTLINCVCVGGNW